MKRKWFRWKIIEVKEKGKHKKLFKKKPKYGLWYKNCFFDIHIFTL